MAPDPWVVFEGHRMKRSGAELLQGKMREPVKRFEFPSVIETREEPISKHPDWRNTELWKGALRPEAATQ